MLYCRTRFARIEQGSDRARDRTGAFYPNCLTVEKGTLPSVPNRCSTRTEDSSIPVA